MAETAIAESFFSKEQKITSTIKKISVGEERH
jgi:hypothetical protein